MQHSKIIANVPTVSIQMLGKQAWFFHCTVQAASPAAASDSFPFSQDTPGALRLIHACFNASDAEIRFSGSAWSIRSTRSRPSMDTIVADENE